MTESLPAGKKQSVKKEIFDYVQLDQLQQSGGKLVAQWEVNGELPFFDGHFPGNPILPAICIIAISLHLISQFYPQISLQEIQVKRSKFMAMVHPGDVVEICAESDDQKNWKVLWQNTKDQQKLAQLSLVVWLSHNFMNNCVYVFQCFYRAELLHIHFDFNFIF